MREDALLILIFDARLTLLELTGKAQSHHKFLLDGCVFFPYLVYYDLILIQFNTDDGSYSVVDTE